MPGRRTEFSLNSLQIILLISGGLLSIVLSFAVGVMVGKGNIEGLPRLNEQVKSQVVKMKVDSPPAVQAPAHVVQKEEKAPVMNNVTSKPVITFYDTLAGKNGKSQEPPAPKEQHEAKKETPKNNNEEAATKKKYTLQAGAMKDKEAAEALASKLKKFGYSAYIVHPAVPGKHALFKVRLGTFQNREDAAKEASRIKRNDDIAVIVVEK